MYTTSTDRKKFRFIEEAKRHIESLPYWAEAISKDGLTQTVFGHDGIGVLQRSACVTGLGSSREVVMSAWYRL